MREKIKEFYKINDEDVLMIVLAFIAFSFGVWSSYGQLWLQSNGFDLEGISNVLSIALVCSAIISFVVSLFSDKVKIKDIIILFMIIRVFSLTILLLTKDHYIIRVCMLLCIMSEVIFSISFYPLLSTVNKGEDAYRKHALISYIAKDAAIISCGLLIGVVVGNIVFDLNSCLFIALVSNILGIISLFLFNQNKLYKKKNILPFKKSLRNLFKSRVTNYFLFIQFIANITYGMVFGLMMILLTDYLNFEISFASIFVIICNVFGSIACSLFIRFGKKLSIKLSVLIKYVPRVIIYISSLLIAIVTSRVLDDKVNGTYIIKIDTDSQFLFGNIRYFVLSLGEGAGIYLAGALLKISFSSLFLGAAIITILQIIMFIMLDNLSQK